MADTNEGEGMGKMSHTIIVYGRVVKENGKIGRNEWCSRQPEHQLRDGRKNHRRNTAMLDAGPRAPAPRSIFFLFFLFADTFLFFYMNRPNEIENVFPSTTDPSYNPRMAFKAAIHLLGDHVMKWFN